jgi:hypothetical protein
VIRQESQVARNPELLQQWSRSRFLASAVYLFFELDERSSSRNSEWISPL